MSDQTSGGGDTVKLSIFGVIGDAFRAVFGNFGAAILAGIFPLILLIAIQTLSYFVAPTGTTGSFFLDLSISVIGMIPYVLFAVTWHRFILMGERERPTLIPKFQRTHGRFLMFTVILFLMVMVPILISAMTMGVSQMLMNSSQIGAAVELDGQASAALLIIFVYLIASSYFYGRLSMVLPASAVGEEGYTFGWAWRHTKGNGFRIMLAFILLMILVAIVFTIYGMIVGLILAGFATSGSVVFTIIIGVVVISPIYIIVTALFISLLSVIFRDLTGYQPPWERA